MPTHNPNESKARAMFRGISGNFWVSFAALCGLVATLALVKPAGRHVHGAATAA